MKLTFINPFEEVEKGVRPGDLSSFHPYWENYVKLRVIYECFRMQEKLDNVKDNDYLFCREFSKNTTPETVQNRINKRLSDCFGAVNSLVYKCKMPCGKELINVC